MARDEFLDDLGQKLDQTKKHRDTCKEVRDLAKKELDSFQPRFTQISNDIADAKRQKEYYSTQAYHARREKSSMASHYASEARSYGERLQSLYRYQNQLKADQRTARERHEKAKADLNAAYNEIERLRKAIEDRKEELRAQSQRAKDDRWQQQSGSRINYFGTGDETLTRREVGGDNKWTAPVHGTTADGKPITASFGRTGTSQEGGILYRDGHAENMSEFYGPKGAKEHEHDDGKGGGTDRGKAPNTREE